MLLESRFSWSLLTHLSLLSFLGWSWIHSNRPQNRMILSYLMISLTTYLHKKISGIGMLQLSGTGDRMGEKEGEKIKRK